MSVHRLDAADPEAFLRAAIAYANDRLYGTLGANVLIHPATIAKIGKARFEAILAELRYGCIAVNAWTGLGFLIAQAPWGAFPAIRSTTCAAASVSSQQLHVRQAGADRRHRAVPAVPPHRAERRPDHAAPAAVVRHQRRQHVVGRLLTAFQYKPSWLKLPRIFFHALLG